MSVRQIAYDNAVGPGPQLSRLSARVVGNHRRSADIVLGPPAATLLSRRAYIEGLGYGVKSVTVFDENARQGLPTIQGAMLVFEPEHEVLLVCASNDLALPDAA